MHINFGLGGILIKMSLYNLPNSTTGIDSIIVDTAKAVPSLIPMFLVFVFSFVLLSGTSAQRRRTGYADFPMWTILASLSTLIITLPLTLTTGIIQTEVLVIVVIVTMLSGLWFFLSKGRGEV